MCIQLFIRILSELNRIALKLILKTFYLQFRVEGRLFYAHKLVLITSSFKFRSTAFLFLI